VLYSRDDGATWELVADHLPNSGTFTWQTPYQPSSTARLAVVLVERQLDGDEVEGVLGIGPRFGVGTPAGAGLPAAELALHPIAPQPARGALRLRFTLPDASAATLAVYDAAGRRVWSRDVGALGAGVHSLSVDGSTLRPGLYLVRLARGGKKLDARAVLVR
jgi:hypothetical protein